jgi:hypothetical protein
MAMTRNHLLLVVLTGCAAAKATSRPPPFDGTENESWLAYRVDGIERPDLLSAFEASARSHGCDTARLGSESSPTIGGLRHQWYGISAACDEGTIAIVTLVGGRVKIGCPRPMTQEDCDGLLRRISEAR